MMITININGISYKLPMDRLSELMNWMNANGATKVLETNSVDTQGRTLINE